MNGLRGEAPPRTGRHSWAASVRAILKLLWVDKEGEASPSHWFSVSHNIWKSSGKLYYYFQIQKLKGKKAIFSFGLFLIDWKIGEKCLPLLCCQAQPEPALSTASPFLAPWGTLRQQGDEGWARPCHGTTHWSLLLKRQLAIILSVMSEGQHWLLRTKQINHRKTQTGFFKILKRCNCLRGEVRPKFKALLCRVTETAWLSTRPREAFIRLTRNALSSPQRSACACPSRHKVYTCNSLWTFRESKDTVQWRHIILQ